MSDKPPYAIPPMAEILGSPRNGLKVVSTFSGCGGFCLGLEWAGFTAVWASEFVEAAREVYELNHPGVPVDARDIRDVRAKDILADIGMAEGELDLFEGAPPCSSFSMAGKRAGGWEAVKKYSDTEQRTDDLFFEYARILKGLQPRAFMAENVPALATGVAKGYYKQILKTLRGCGYRVNAKVLDASWLGVPQARKRLFFVGVRSDLGIAPPFPKPLRYRYSIRDALPWVHRVRHVTMGHEGTREFDADREPINTIRAGGGGAQLRYEVEGEEPLQWLDGYAIGREWDKLKPGQQSKKYFQLVRPDPDKPCPTVTQTGGVVGAASVTHPTEKRKFTIPELRRLCGFPDDFVLTGTYRQQWERLGRAVPPPVSRALGLAMAEALGSA